MMTNIEPSECPNREYWRQVLTSESLAQTGELEQHLEHCDSCQRIYNSLLSEDPLLSIICSTMGQLEPPEPMDDRTKEKLHAFLETARSRWPADTVQSGVVTPADANRLVGHSLGNFEILKVLGTGGMGTVYLAKDSRLLRTVALKVLREATGNREEYISRFLREAQLAASLHHPGIATIYEVGESQGIPFIAMELLKGETLADYLRTNAPLDLKQALDIAGQVFQALSAAHEKGIVHRDIKPSNIWLERTTQGILKAKLLDFGIAKLVDTSGDLTKSGSILGTPEFMSPEQIRGVPVTPQSDLFSVGSVLYQMLTARSPFRSTDTVSTLFQVTHSEPTGIDKLNTIIPKPVAEFVHSLLEKEVVKRPTSAAAAATEVERFSGQLAFDEKRRAPQSKASRFRIPPIAGIALGSAFAFALIAFGIFWKIETDKGIFQIELEDESIAIKLQKEGLVIEDDSGKRYTLRAEGSFRTPAGAYRPAENQNLRMQLLTDEGIQADVEKFELVRGETVRLRITLKDKAAPNAGDRNRSLKNNPTPVRLDPNQIPSEERFELQPSELVAVIGRHSRNAWGANTEAPWIDPLNRFVVQNGAGASQKDLWSFEEHAQPIEMKEKIPIYQNSLQVFSTDGSRMAFGNYVYRVSGTLESLSIDTLYEKPLQCGGASVLSGDGRWLVAAEPETIANIQRLLVWRLEEKEPRLVASIAIGRAIDVRDIWLRWIDKEQKLLMYVENGSEATTTHWSVDWSDPESPRFGEVEVKQGEWVYSADKTFALVRTRQECVLQPLNSDTPARNWTCAALRPGYIAISPDSQWIASCNGGAIDLLHKTGDQWETFQIPHKIPNLGPLSFSHDSKTLVVGSYVCGSFVFYDLNQPIPLEKWPQTDVAYLDGLEFSPDGRLLATSGPIGSALYDVTDVKPVQLSETKYTQGTYGWSFDPDVSFAAVGFNQIFDLRSDPVRRLREMPIDGLSSRLFFGDRSDQLYRVVYDGKQRIEELQLEYDEKWPDVRFTVKQLREIDKEPIVSLRYSAAGKYLLTQPEGSSTIKKWNLDHFETEPASFEGRGPGYANSLNISRDGKLALSCSLGSNSIYVFDMEQNPPKRREIPARSARAAFLGENNEYLIAIASDIVVYDLAYGKPIWRRQLPGNMTDVAVHPDGQHVAVLNGNSTVYLYRLNDLRANAENSAEE